jgi:hypothetical protein
MVLSMLLARRWLMPTVDDLAAAIEVYNVSAEDLYARDGFRRHEGSPASWSAISLSYQRDPAVGTYQKFLRCRMLADEVRATNRSFFAAGLPQRTRDGLPPSWWKQAGVPDWFRPTGASQWRMDRTERGWIGQYLSFEPGQTDEDPGWLHVWEWLDPQPPSAPLTVKPFGIDLLSQEVGQHLLSQQWPVRPDGWLEAPGQVPPPQWRSYAPNVDCWLLPRQGWFALRLRQVSPDLIQEMLLEGLPFETISAADIPLPLTWPLSLAFGPAQAYVVRDPVSLAVVRARVLQWQGADVLICDWTSGE